ncbi:MAG: hypothetical protein AAB316_20200, partial [Bacteroidota bacterium]
MTGNLRPLAGWYFCACLKIPPKEASVFLSILETLHNPESGVQLVAGAFKELARLDAWQQVYILPAALDALRREDLPPDFGDSFKAYLKKLKDYLQDISLSSDDSDAANPLADLFDAVLSHSNWGVRGNLKNAIAQVANQAPAQDSSGQLAIPYLALIDFLPQTLLLAALHFLARDEQFSALVENEWKENSLLPEFLSDALNYRFGRQAFILAGYFYLELAARKWLPVRDLPGVAAMEKASPCFVLEPDLVQVYADCRSARLAQEIKDPGAALLEEYLSLGHFRQILLGEGWFPFSRNPRHADNLSALVERAGGKKREDWLALAVTYWQAAQVNVLLLVDVSKLLEQLPKLWEPSKAFPEKAIISNLPMLPPGRNRELPDEICLVEEIFQVLAEVKTGREIPIGRYHVEGRKSQNDQFAEQFLHKQYPSWLFFSPWFSHRGYRESPYYIEPGNAAGLLRLANAFFVAQHILQGDFPQAIPPEVQSAMARLLLHGSDVLSLFSNHLNSLKFDEKNPQKSQLALPLPLSSLGLWMRRQCELIAQGFFPSLTADIFGSLLDDPNQPRGDAWFFYCNVLPKTLLAWANVAFPLACAGSRALDWFEGEGSAVRRIFEKEQKEWEKPPVVSEIDVLEFHLLFRFLLRHQDDPGAHFARFDWREGKFNALKNRLVASPPSGCWAQQFLLTGAVEAAFWTTHAWDEEKKDLRWVERNIERWFSTTVYEGDYDLNAQWYEEFQNTLKSIDSRRDLHRFVKIRLVEILEAFIARPIGMFLTDAISIARLLLEFGSPYELHRLLEVIFPHENGILKPVRQEEGVGTLQLSVLSSLRFFSEGGNQDFAQTSAGLPEQEAWHWLRAEVVESLFHRLAFSAWNTKKNAPASSKGLFEKMEAMTKAKCQAERDKQNEHTDTYELSYVRRNGQTFSRVEALKDVQPFKIKRAVVNPNSGQVKVVFDPIHKASGKYISLFEKPQYQLKRIGESEEVNLKDVLARCVDAWYPEGWAIRLFNCGLKFHLRQELPPGRPWEEDIKPGAWVLLDIRVTKDNWNLQSVKPLKMTAETGVREGLLPNLSARKLGKNIIPLQLAFPDVAGWLTYFSTRQQELEKVKFWTRFNPETGAREPYPFGLPELLLWVDYFAGQAVLAFVREEPASGTLIFSTSPGIHFHLRQAHFLEPENDQAAALPLRSFFQSSKDLTGELLTVRPVFRQGKVLLEIVAEVEPDKKLEKL